MAMNFLFTEEQTLLAESVNKYVRDNFDLEQRRQIEKTELGFMPEQWQTFAELGWLALPFSESSGGLDGSVVDTSIIMNGIGQGLRQEPYLASIVLAGTALRIAANETQSAHYIGPLLDGSLKGSFAYVEPQSRYNHYNIETTATQQESGFILNGTKSVVLNANAADFIIVSARTKGESTDRDGISLFIVDTQADGVTMQDYPTVDGLHAAEVLFENVTLSESNLLGTLHKAADTLDTVMNEAIIAVAAEAVGAMEVLYRDTADYAQQRVQFDHPLSDFQVVKHRLVDMFMQTEQAKALQERAAKEYEEDPQTAQKSIHALKVLIGQAGRFVGENAVQLHGGMGMTEELKIGHYFKRLVVINSMFGDMDFHFEKFMACQD